MLLGRDEESLSGPRSAEHHLGARAVFSIRMVSPPTAQTIVSASPNRILTSLLLGFRYPLSAQAPIRRESRFDAGACARALGAPRHPHDDSTSLAEISQTADDATVAPS